MIIPVEKGGAVLMRPANAARSRLPTSQVGLPASQSGRTKGRHPFLLC
jgi:hypothetical protein